MLLHWPTRCPVLSYGGCRHAWFGLFSLTLGLAVSVPSYPITYALPPITYALPMGCSVLNYLRACYAMSGTELKALALTGLSVWGKAAWGKKVWAYALATRCPVLTDRMLAWSYAMSGTDKPYAALFLRAGSGTDGMLLPGRGRDAAGSLRVPRYKRWYRLLRHVRVWWNVVFRSCYAVSGTEEAAYTRPARLSCYAQHRDTELGYAATGVCVAERNERQSSAVLQVAYAPTRICPPTRVLSRCTSTTGHLHTCTRTPVISRRASTEDANASLKSIFLNAAAILMIGVGLMLREQVRSILLRFPYAVSGTNMHCAAHSLRGVLQ
eukprot:2879817-Rhodomonas_salina.6